MGGIEQLTGQGRLAQRIAAGARISAWRIVALPNVMQIRLLRTVAEVSRVAVDIAAEADDQSSHRYNRDQAHNGFGYLPREPRARPSGDRGLAEQPSQQRLWNQHQTQAGERRHKELEIQHGGSVDDAGELLSIRNQSEGCESPALGSEHEANADQRREDARSPLPNRRGQPEQSRD